MRQFELRLQTLQDVENETPLLDLPVKFKGVAEAGKQYAIQHGFVWLFRPRMLFGGYFFNETTSESLLPT